MLVWLLITILYYYSYWDFYISEANVTIDGTETTVTGRDYIFPGLSGTQTGKGIAPGWGFLVQILVFAYQCMNISHAFKGL